MKQVSCALCLLLLLATGACKKNTEAPAAPPAEQHTTFPAPGWKADESGRYPASMTAVVTIPAALQASLGDADQLAAFVNNECRGVGVLDKVNNAYVFFMLIRGLPDEQSKITFKYYSVKTSYLYQTGPDLSFLIDAVYGTAQNPKVLALAEVK